MQTHNKDISEAYFQRAIGLIALMIMNLQGTVNAAADSLSTTNMYGRWYTVKYGEGDRRQYIKLHAIADMPFFIYAKVSY